MYGVTKISLVYVVSDENGKVVTDRTDSMITFPSSKEAVRLAEALNKGFVPVEYADVWMMGFVAGFYEYGK